MKVSESQKRKTRKQLIEAAVDLFSERGIDQTTMKQVARAAGVGDATIYKYFPNKEKLLTGYFIWAAETAVETAASVDGVEEFELQERLQLLVDSYLDVLLPEREFVAEILKRFYQAPLSIVTDGLPGQNVFKDCIGEYFDLAIAQGEMEPLPFKEGVVSLLSDYVFALVLFWQRDESEEFAQTTQLVDLSLSCLVLLLKSGLISKLMDLGGFLLKTQLFRLIERGEGVQQLMQSLQLFRSGLGGMAGEK